MRLVYVYRYDDPDERRYLYRRPLVWAWLQCRFRPVFDYARFWYQGGAE